MIIKAWTSQVIGILLGVVCTLGVGLRPLIKIVSSSPCIGKRRSLLIVWQRAPGPYIQPEDEKLFNVWPESYEPNPEYPGTCAPGLGRENRPLSELDFDNIREEYDEYAMFEVPFHLRWPANHPWLAGPYERLERAGRFRTSTEIEIAIKDVRGRNKKRNNENTQDNGEGTLGNLQTLDAIEDDSDLEVDDADTDHDPLFDDKSSSLLDAALGLDDDDSEEEEEEKKQ